MTLAGICQHRLTAGTMVTMTGYQDHARRGAVGSGVADRSRTCVPPSKRRA